jgi:hypothetical protein
MVKGAVWSDGIRGGRNQTNVIAKSTKNFYFVLRFVYYVLRWLKVSGTDNVLIITIFVGFRGDLNADTLLTNTDL